MNGSTPSALALVVAAGEMASIEQLANACVAADFIVAVDGGLKWLNEAGCAPHMLVGDFDSVDDIDFSKIDSSVVIQRYRSDKDETDLQLALAECCNRSYKNIVIFGAMGGRLDHAFMNLSLLPMFFDKLTTCTLIDGGVEVSVVRSRLTIHGQPGDLVSLLPFDLEVSGITTTGLTYPLMRDTLTRGGLPAGISNVMNGHVAEVCVESGYLLTFVIRRNPSTWTFA